MGQQDFFPLGRVDDLIDLSIRKKDDFGRIIAHRMVFHLVDEVRQHPDSGQQAPVHVPQAVLGGAIKIVHLPDTVLSDEIGQQIPGFVLFPRMQPQKLPFRHDLVHGNIPQQGGGLPLIDLCACFHGLSPRTVYCCAYYRRIIGVLFALPFGAVWAYAC